MNRTSDYLQELINQKKYLQELINQKKQLANNLTIKGINASEEEKFNTLVPKVLSIKSGITPSGTKEININNSPSFETVIDVSSYANVVVKGSSSELIQLNFKENESSMNYNCKPFFMRDIFIIKPSTLIPNNIRKGVKIAGITGTIEEGITPTGTLEIVENGEYDVTGYAKVIINIPNI